MGLKIAKEIGQAPKPCVEALGYRYGAFEMLLSVIYVRTTVELKNAVAVINFLHR